MIRILFALLCLVALGAQAQTTLKHTATNYGYARYTGAAAVKRLTDTPASGTALPTQRPDGSSGKPTYAVIVIEGGTARWTDGSQGGSQVTPTSSVGTPLAGELDYDGDMGAFQIFLPNNVTMSVNYYD